MPEHHKIAAQAIKRINKRGWFIFFKKEMAKPGKTIAAKRDNYKPKPLAGNDSENNTNKYQKRSGKM